MLVNSSFSPSTVPLPPNADEFLLSSTSFINATLYIGTFYRLPSSPASLSSLSSLLSNLRPSNLILVGNFNIHFSPSSSSPLFLQLQSLADSYPLYQVISDPTHISHSGTPSTIDLAFIPSIYQSNHVILPPVSTFDHNSILLSVYLPPSSFLPHVKSSSHRIWLYSQADISKIIDLLSSTPWDTLLSSDIDSS